MRHMNVAVWFCLSTFVRFSIFPSEIKINSIRFVRLQHRRINELCFVDGVAVVDAIVFVLENCSSPSRSKQISIRFSFFLTFFLPFFFSVRFCRRFFFHLSRFIRIQYFHFTSFLIPYRHSHILFSFSPFFPRIFFNSCFLASFFFRVAATMSRLWLICTAWVKVKAFHFYFWFISRFVMCSSVWWIYVFRCFRAFQNDWHDVVFVHRSQLIILALRTKCCTICSSYCCTSSSPFNTDKLFLAIESWKLNVYAQILWWSMPNANDIQSLQKREEKGFVFIHCLYHF